MNGEMWKLYCEMGLLVLELGQKEYMAIPWMITDFEWRRKQIKALLYRIVEICVHGIALFKILF